MQSAYKTRAAVRMTGVLLTVVLLALTAVLVGVQFRADKSMAQTQAHRDAHVVATQFGSIFTASAQALQRIAEALGPAPAGPADTVRDIAQAVRDLPPGSLHSVYNAQGDLILSSLPQPRAINIADRDYFRMARDGQVLSISPMITDRASGEKVIIMARRLEREGQFNGVATIAIPMARMAELADSLGIGGNSTISLVRSDGMMIARFPPVEPINLKGWILFDKLKESPSGFYDSVSPTDKVARIVGYWKIDDWPVIAATGIDRNLALAAFGRQAWMAIWLALPALGAVVWLMYHLSQILRRDADRQAELQAANERAGVLLREVHHRVKNNLQTVISLIRLERIPPDVKQSLLSRIGAMAAVHEGMYQSDQFETVEVAPYLRRLVSNVAAGYGGGVQVRMDIAPVSLSGDRAMQLGLLANEVVSNAFKHAFRDGAPGKLDVLLEQAGDRLTLSIRDDGPGFDPETIQRNMGSRLVEGFAATLGGTLDIDGRHGTTVRVDFPQHHTAA
ncbi:MAG: histidine kinase dimerization/phosphoacceptor domain -containing protein [Paracoccaceae bacterium]